MDKKDLVITWKEDKYIGTCRGYDYIPLHIFDDSNIGKTKTHHWDTDRDKRRYKAQCTVMKIPGGYSLTYKASKQNRGVYLGTLKVRNLASKKPKVTFTHIIDEPDDVSRK